MIVWLLLLIVWYYDLIVDHPIRVVELFNPLHVPRKQDISDNLKVNQIIISWSDSPLILIIYRHAGAISVYNNVCPTKVCQTVTLASVALKRWVEKSIVWMWCMLDLFWRVLYTCMHADGEVSLQLLLYQWLEFHLTFPAFTVKFTIMMWWGGSNWLVKLYSHW